MEKIKLGFKYFIFMIFQYYLVFIHKIKKKNSIKHYLFLPCVIAMVDRSFDVTLS